MLDDFLKRKLELVLMPANYFSEDLEEMRLKAYDCWKEAWDLAFKKEMNFLEPLFSDGFKRQTTLAVVFYQGEPLVLSTLNHLRLESRIDRDDSFFKVWDHPTKELLYKEAREIIVCGNLVLNFKYRKNALGFSGKDLMFATLIHYLKTLSNVDAMVSVVRRDRGMEKSAYRTGAHPLITDQPFFIPGQRMDIVSWSKSLDLNLFDPTILELSRWIWMNNTKIFEDKIQKGVSHAA